MTVLKISEPIIMATNNLLKVYLLSFGVKSERLQDGEGLIEQVQNIMKTGHGSQVDAVRHQILASKARQKMQVGRLRSREGRGKAQGHLGEVRAVPSRLGPEQGRRNDDLKEGE